MAVDVTEYYFLFLIWLISTVVMHFIIKIWANSLNKQKPRPPPGPLALPIIGHLHLLSSTLPKSLKTLANRYGPLMQIRMGDTLFVIVSDANTAEKVLKTHDIDFASKYEPGPSQKLLYKGCSFINAPYSLYWRFMKKICVTKLFTSSQLQRFTHVREEERTKLLKTLIGRSETGEPCDLSKELEALTSLMIYRMTMGNRSSSLSSSGDYNYSVEAMEMRRHIRNIMECGKKYAVIEVFGPLRRFDLFGNGKRIEMAFLGYDQRLEQIIHEYEENRMNNIIDGENEEKDVMDILLETCRDSSAEVMITISHIKYLFMEIFMASVDSTSTAMQSAMAEIINRPEIFKKLREEINSVVGSNQLVKESDVPNLPYLQAVLKETLRLHPPGPMLRRTATVDSKINGYDIKAGTKMFVNCYAIMRDPNVWKDPDKFMPERFLNCCDRVMDFKGQDFCYLPFGSGRRACFGAPHAAYVIHATVASLVQCFDWKLEGGDKAGIDIVSGYTGAMAHPLVCYPIVNFDPFKA
ncbi:hypothetical protein Dsin_011668 [Dipteronia sinensis]|uniref:Cytochrome P450 n=1 Tax=Dipteronia sinensis TaxID=43782 RepID=A0AAE0AH22_9ROSI|nr:hypothetical protein Dsin_011668 [Dipteronia sinensis]